MTDNEKRTRRLRHLNTCLQVEWEIKQERSKTYDDECLKLKSNLRVLETKLKEFLSKIDPNQDREQWNSISKLIEKVKNLDDPKEVYPREIAKATIMFAGASIGSYYLGTTLLSAAPGIAEALPAVPLPESNTAKGVIGIGALLFVAYVANEMKKAAVREEIQKNTKEALDKRYVAVLNNLYLAESVKAISSLSNGIEIIIRNIERYGDKGIENTAEDLATQAELFRKQVEENVTPERVMRILENKDRGQWVDIEVERNWQPPRNQSQDQGGTTKKRSQVKI